MFKRSLLSRFFRTTSRCCVQPLYHTHPHLFRQPDDLTPGISAKEYHERRRKLMDFIPSSQGMVILKGNKLTYATQNIFYPFQQNTNFFYLTGIDEPDCVLAIEKKPTSPPPSSSSPSSRPYRLHLFLPPISELESRWTGPTLTDHDLCTTFGVDTVHRVADPTDLLASVRVPVYTDATAARWVHALRVVKSDAEVAVLREANRITHEAFVQCYRRHGSWGNEADLANQVEYVMRKGGAAKLAYVPVVAGGTRACVLHATQNDQVVKEDELVLMDAGCQYGYYASDITRTFPSSKRFTQPQKDLYNAVLNTQEACLKLVSPNISLDELHAFSVMYLTEELNQLDFRTDKKTVAEHLYFHHLGHYLGLDVHDTPTFPRHVALQPGMVITLEPGIYVPSSPLFPTKYHGIGIRIEDNVLVTSSGYQFLVDEIAPKSVDEIEKMRAG